MHGFRLTDTPKNIPATPCIYKITNTVNWKIYIGQTRNFKGRFYSYRSAKDKAVICRAIRKYGKEKFIIEPIVFPTINQLNDEEIYYIKFFNSLDRKIGYNIAEFPQIGINTNLRRRKKVINIETGTVYSSAKEAGIAEGIKRTTLTGYLRGEYTNKTKLKYL